MLTFHSLKVIARADIAEDALCLTFEVPDTLRAAYCSEAGQHITLRAHIEGKEVRRTYSLIDPPGERHLRIGVRTQPNGLMSQYLAHSVREGDAIDVLTPTGRFCLPVHSGDAKCYLAFASGSGITPILSMTSTVLTSGLEHRMTLVLGNRTAARAMFVEEILALKDQYLDRLALHWIMSGEPQDIELFNGRIDRCKVTELAQTVFDPSAVDEYFVCGPHSMIAEVHAALIELRVAPEHIHSERFSVQDEVTALEAPPMGNAAKSKLATAAGTERAEITVLMDGRRRSFSMPRDGESILEGAKRVGIDLPYSCCAGVCSTCRTKVTQGRTVMDGTFVLEDWEIAAGYILCCQSRPVTPQVEISYDEQ